MRLTRDNWLYHLIIISLVMLPLQYSKAMNLDSMNDSASVCHKLDNQHSNDGSQEKCQHHEQMTAKDGKLCDKSQGCIDHGHCAQHHSLDKQVKSHADYFVRASHRIQFISSTFFEFYPHPDLRPPQV